MRFEQFLHPSTYVQILMFPIEIQVSLVREYWYTALQDMLLLMVLSASILSCGGFLYSIHTGQPAPAGYAIGVFIFHLMVYLCVCFSVCLYLVFIYPYVALYEGLYELVYGNET